jgi:hypothetical protein
MAVPRPRVLAARYCAPAVLLACAAGCAVNEAAEARKALPAHYPAVVNNWRGRVERVEFNEPFSLDEYTAVVFLPLDTAHTPLPPNDNTYEPTVQALARSTTVVSQGVERKLKLVPVTVATSQQPPGGKVVVLRAAVTEMNPGSQAARYWVSFGAGSAGTRISGEVLDGPTGRTLLRFKDGSVTGGGMFGGGYDEVLDANMKQLGEDLGVLLSGFSERAAAKKE